MTLGKGMDSASSQEPVVEIVEAPKRQRVVRKKVELVSLEWEEPAPAPKKTREKLTDEESEPAIVSFTSAKGDVTFSARKRAKPPDAAPPPESPPVAAPLVRVPPAKAPALHPARARQQPTQVKAPPTPGLYDILHAHLSARGAERSQRWEQFRIA